MRSIAEIQQVNSGEAFKDRTSIIVFRAAILNKNINLMSDGVIL